MPLNKVATLHWTATYNVTMLGTHTYTNHEKFAIHSPVHGYLGLARLVQPWKVSINQSIYFHSGLYTIVKVNSLKICRICRAFVTVINEVI